MSRRSPRKKAISPEIVISSDDEELMAVASEDQDEDVGGSDDGEDEIIEITPPPTPSPVKAAGGKKRAIATYESDDNNVFVPSPTHDSPKKARAKSSLTPVKVSKTVRQVLFNTTGSETGMGVENSLPITKGGKGKAPASSKSPSKSVPRAIELDDSTVFLADVEMRRVSVPDLAKCQIYRSALADVLLKDTYRKIPKLPRMADYAATWSQLERCQDGGVQFSEVLHLYNNPDIEYLKKLITFSHDRVGNIANLSRIDPSLLGVKDASSYTKNALYLHGVSSAPLLCFSLILVTRDSHEHGRTLGSTAEKEWVLKDIAGVMLALELERFISVLGLAYEHPYVPEDSARREGDLLYFSMVDNAFSFTTSMMLKSDLYKADSSSKSTPQRMNKHKIFAPASPAFSTKAAVASTAVRKASLRPSETVPVYDGRKRQLTVPDELRRIPDTLPRYVGDMPEYSLALVAYTVSTYSAISGPRKNQLTANLHIHFGVVLHEPKYESKDGDE